MLGTYKLSRRLFVSHKEESVAEEVLSARHFINSKRTRVIFQSCRCCSPPNVVAADERGHLSGAPVQSCTGEPLAALQTSPPAILKACRFCPVLLFARPRVPGQIKCALPEVWVIP
jgi:hypothetical protein